jgi:hypothetical protein
VHEYDIGFALLVGALAFAGFAFLCASICLYLCMRRLLQPTPPYQRPPVADKFVPGDAWLSWVPPDSKPEPMWWHAADKPAELVEAEPPSWAYNNPNPLSNDKTIAYAGTAQAIRVDVAQEPLAPPAVPLPHDFVFGAGDVFFEGDHSPGVRADGSPAARGGPSGALYSSG